MQVDVRERTASLRYPETNEEEHVSLDELIQEKCIAVGELLWCMSLHNKQPLQEPQLCLLSIG